VRTRHHFASRMILWSMAGMSFHGGSPPISGTRRLSWGTTSIAPKHSAARYPTTATSMPGP